MTVRRRPPDGDPARLRRNVDFALAHDFAVDDLVPMLSSLARASERGSPSWVLAHTKLAELLVERAPWRAAAAARNAIIHAPDDEIPRALLALALTVLGHYHAAARAYREALAIAPDNPWYAHNLGHLLDVALGRPVDAVPLLRRAHAAEPHVEIAASLAHALGRVGRAADARRILTKALRGDDSPSADHVALLAWLDDGAPTTTRGRPAPSARGSRR